MQNKFLSKSVPRGTRTIWRYLGALFILFTFAIGNVWGEGITSPYKITLNGSGNAQTVCTALAAGTAMTDGSGTTVTSNPEVTWTLTKQEGTTTFTVARNSNGLKIGNGTSDYGGVTISSSSFAAYKITKVAILAKNQTNKSGANVMTTTWDVTVGGTALGTQKTITNDNTDKTLNFENSDGLQGNLQIVCANTGAYKNYYFIKSIEVTFAESSGGSTTYSISYVMNGHGDQIAQATGQTALPATLPTPTADGWTFVKWYTNEGLTVAAEPGATLTANATLYAKWTENSTPVDPTPAKRSLFSMDVTYNGSSEVSFEGSQLSELGTYGTATGGYVTLWNKDTGAGKIKINKGSGLCFNGGNAFAVLYLNEPLHQGDKFVFAEGSTSNNRQIRIGLEGTQNVYEATTTNLEYVIPENSQLIGKQVIYLARVNSSTYFKTLTIETETAVPTFRTVTFDPNYTSATNITRTVADGAKVVYVPKDPENGTQEFEGWFEGSAENAFDFSTVITADKTLTAHWSAPVVKNTISFNSDGGTAVESIEVEDGQVATAPTAPKKVGYEFDKWYNGEAVYDWSAAVTGDLTLTAHWNKVYVPQGANYVFENTATLGTAPNNAITVTKDNKKNSIAANSRIDNMWLSAMDVYLEDGTYDGGEDDFKGWKIKTASATIKFFVESDCRVTVTTGTLSSGMNIAYTNTSSEAQNAALVAKQANNYDVKAGTLVTLTTQGGNTVTLKGIAVSDIPAQSDDATLSDLKVGGTKISGFNSSVTSYYVEMPYGTAKADLPLVTVTTNEEHAVATVQDAKDRPDDTRATIHVVAQNGTSDKYYYVYFTVAPKYGVELIKATHNGTENGATVTGYIGGTVDKLTQNNGKLGSGAPDKTDPHHYFGIQLAEGTFKAGDMLVIKASALNGGNAATLYSDKGNTEIKIDGQFDTNSKMYVYTLEADVEKIYLYRQTSGCNPNVEYMAVYRLMAPFIEEFKIGEAVGTIDKSAKTIAVEVPYSADLEHLTPTVKYWANGGGTITPAIGETDFSGVVNYTVSSAYAEDETGDYAPVTYAVTVSKAAHYEAKIGETGYATLVEAVAAAVDGDVVVLQENVTAGAGVMIAKADAKQITIDFGGYTYTANSPAVGSVGTQNQAFHFEKGCNITLKNGTIACSGSEIKMLIQNYGDLTLENITLDGTGLEGSHRYVMSNNCGDVVIGNGTTITAKAGDVAFDVCATNYYPEGVTVTVKDGASITGIVEYDVWGTKPAENKAELAIEGGNFNITWNVEDALTEDAKENLNVSGGQFSEIVPADYCAEGYAPYQIAEGKYGVQAEGVIRAAAAQNGANIYMCTLDNGVKIYASNSEGKLSTSTMTATSNDVKNCGGDDGGYNVNKSAFVLQFPVNVKEFTLYGANSEARTFSEIKINATADADTKIENAITGTYSYEKEEGQKCQTLTAVFDDANVIPANYYVLVKLSGSVNFYRVLYTEAECTAPTVTVADQTAKENVEVTLTANATALGATYQWYQLNGENYELMPGKTAKTLTVTKVGEADQFYKVVVGCNCSEETAEDVAKVSLYTEVTTLVDVTGYTVWDWSTIVNDVDGVAIGDDGKKVNGANGILANYIQGTSMDKIESNNGAYAIRSNSNQYYQGASLHMHTTKGGILKIHARNDGNTMTLNVQNAGRDIEIGSLGNWKDYTIYVQAGDVVIYNVPETEGKPMRIDQMTFTVKESPDYPRDVTNNIGTLCVEHNVLAGGALGATFYQIASRNETYPDKIDFEEVMPGEELKAGEPYIFKSNTGKIELYYGETVADGPVAVRGMIGNYESSTLDIDEENKLDILYIANNKLYNCSNLVGGKLILNDHRAYIKMSDVPTYAEYQASQSNSQPNNARRRVTLSMNGTNSATDIDNIFGNDTKAEKVLINGQLFILRGGKMFDATGRLVK